MDLRNLRTKVRRPHPTLDAPGPLAAMRPCPALADRAVLTELRRWWERPRGRVGPGADNAEAHWATLPVRPLVFLGMAIGGYSNWSLADSCVADARYPGLSTSAPLRLPSGIASPSNALAVW
jgi:hypothetical protein